MIKAPWHSFFYSLKSRLPFGTQTLLHGVIWTPFPPGGHSTNQVFSLSRDKDWLDISFQGVLIVKIRCFQWRRRSLQPTFQRGLPPFISSFCRQNWASSSKWGRALFPYMTSLVTLSSTKHSNLTKNKRIRAQKNFVQKFLCSYFSLCSTFCFFSKDFFLSSFRSGQRNRRGSNRSSKLRAQALKKTLTKNLCGVFRVKKTDFRGHCFLFRSLSLFYNWTINQPNLWILATLQTLIGATDFLHSVFIAWKTFAVEVENNETLLLGSFFLCPRHCDDFEALDFPGHVKRISEFFWFRLHYY